MTIPARPRVEIKAKASGTPAKFEATPEKVVMEGRTNFGKPPSVTAYAKKKPKMPPPSAVTKLMEMLFQ